MTEQQFQFEVRRAEMMGRLASDPTQTDYQIGYIRGLRRQYHGDQFGSQEEHKLWLSLHEEADESRAARGRGYRDGLEFCK